MSSAVAPHKLATNYKFGNVVKFTFSGASLPLLILDKYGMTAKRYVQRMVFTKNGLKFCGFHVVGFLLSM